MSGRECPNIHRLNPLECEHLVIVVQTVREAAPPWSWRFLRTTGSWLLRSLWSRIHIKAQKKNSSCSGYKPINYRGDGERTKQQVEVTTGIFHTVGGNSCSPDDPETTMHFGIPPGDQHLLQDCPAHPYMRVGTDNSIPTKYSPSRDQQIAVVRSTHQAVENIERKQCAWNVRKYTLMDVGTSSRRMEEQLSLQWNWPVIALILRYR